ncbi:MAG: 16S rRNA (guanine(966)-N(2))-methyltransferase RsmD [Proteobacteria bacterium]|nr:16S rRNA (guanine(966)-N(2))-methyltransferase RsmD [Pseudomonadota bacterium]
MVPPAPRPPASRKPVRAGSASPAGAGSVRIIGGRWRGSKLPVADLPGLRPSADRVRETLFNWLQPMLHGANVLDAFAGSGALGLEAASRGAARVVLAESHPTLAAGLREQAQRLARGEDANGVEVVQEDVLRWLTRPPAASFDLVFLDPPFAAGLWERAVAALEPWLAMDAWLYVESPRGQVPALGENWLAHREGHTRDVRFALYRRHAVTLSPASVDQDHARA